MQACAYLAMPPKRIGPGAPRSATPRHASRAGRRLLAVPLPCANTTRIHRGLLEEHFYGRLLLSISRYLERRFLDGGR